jgi:NO-binding membrane sensor protein with MHYT domain
MRWSRAPDLAHRVGDHDRIWNWATHFIAMLALEPGIPNAYNVALTSFSLIVAIVLTAVGFAVAIVPDVRAGAWLGGAIVGAGIAAMHYTGMAAFEIQGRIFWDPTLVAASILLGAVFGSVALRVGLHQGRMYWRLLGALLLTLAICSHHSPPWALPPFSRIRRSQSRTPRCRQACWLSRWRWQR